MPDVTLDLGKPFFLVEILDKDTNDLKYVWSPNIFLDEERPDDDSKIVPESYIEDIEVKSNLVPPINSGEVKINHRVGHTPQINVKDLMKLYLGYYTLDNPQNSVYSLAYTGKIDFIKASLNYTIIRASSIVKKITDTRRELAFSKVMTITDIIKKLAIEDGGLEEAPNGISDTTISKQKGFAISKNMTVYDHIKKLADYVGFDVYMDPFEKFNARLWSPQSPSSSGDSIIIWISDRDSTESDVQNQIMHQLYFGVNTIDMELDITHKKIKDVSITSLADTEGDEILSIEPPVGTKTEGGGSGGGTDSSGGETSELEYTTSKIVLPRFTKEDTEKIAEAMLTINNPGLSGSVTVVGSPQIRLGDGIKILGYIFGRKPFTRINTQSSDYDASFSTEQEGESEGSSSSGGEETTFKITGVRHLFNDKIGFLTKLKVFEAEPIPPEVAARVGAPSEAGADTTGLASEETEFAGVAGAPAEELRITITNAQWDREDARQGDIVTLTADVEGAPDGTQGEIEIYEHDVDGIHDLITKFPVDVINNKIETTWEYEYYEDTDEIPTDEELQKYGLAYNPPEYFFVVKIGAAEDQSGILIYKDYVEITLKNRGGEPIADADYILTLPDGTEIEGKVDSDGYAKVEGLPPGKVTVRFPNL